MIQVALYQPEIPPNTGNVMRLCANAGARLHLIHPLGFRLDDSKLRRAGLDYRDWAEVREHADFATFREALPNAKIWALSTRAKCSVFEARFSAADVLLFGPETRGLPAELLKTLGPESCLRLPMRADSRSLNLSNAVAVTVYEAWRQLGFVGGR